MKTFFHCLSDGVDPEQLLDPDRQFTEPWGTSDHGTCDKCKGEGTALYECRSCLEGRLSEERDLDADAGALLVHPQRLLEVRPVDREIVGALQSRLAVGTSPKRGIESA